MDRATTRTTPPWLSTAVAAVLVGLATTAIAWWRLGPVTRGTVWAEDGGLFLRERIALGAVDSLLHPYAGYLHLVPRLLVDLGRALPVEDYGRVLSGGSCAVVGGLAAVVYVLARDAVPSGPVRAVLAAAPALLPLAPVEISGNAANLHWFMLAAAPWLFAYRARTWAGAAAVAAVTVFVVLTELQTVLFLPLLALAWFPVRDASGARSWPRALPVTVVALAGCTAQVVAAVTDERAADPGPVAFADVLAGWVLQPVVGLWTPDVGAVAGTVVASGWAPVLLPVVALALVVIASLWTGNARSRWVTIALAVASGGVWWAALIANGGSARAWSDPQPDLVGAGPLRYTAASGLLLLTAVLVAAGALVGTGRRDRRGPSPQTDERTGRRRARRRAATTGGAVRRAAQVTGWALVAAVLTTSVLHAAPGPTRRSDGPVWGEQVPAAVAACAGDPTRVVDVKTAPWGAQVPCSWLLRP
ncbi:hypothetical protein [Curtobacterium sp. MCBD17_032]|uniref:hypothetical protein n=1 Tax=Curtobacterium sp. MCBD17_032 TaxID=2175659 RepID=UPI000DAA72C3|nr:hypothetical protein [Curtobacterium sp. MCBD17_032]PZE84960.1 hypothetical protein DEI91_05760 [Curtobacterium sp. MCBD17_032]